MASMVVADYLSQRLALLRLHGRLAWVYTGDNDFGRTQVRAESNLLLDVLEVLMKILLGGSHGVYHLPRLDLTLYDNARYGVIREALFEFDAWGIKMPELGVLGHRLRIDGGPRAVSPRAYIVDEDHLAGKRVRSPSSPIAVSSSPSLPSSP